MMYFDLFYFRVSFESSKATKNLIAQINKKTCSNKIEK